MLFKGEDYIMNKAQLTQLTMELADCTGVSGMETMIVQRCSELMREYTENVRVSNDNVIADFGTRSEDKPHVLIDAHLDRVGLIVTSVTDDGFAKADCIGGLDRRLFPAQRVVIHGEKGDMNGVICTLPPHLKKDSSVMDKDQIYIDPLTDKETAKRLINVGDMISFDSPCVELTGGRISGAGLDDRCGIAAVIQAVDSLNGDYDSLPYTFTVMFSSQEELGERGACVGAFDIDPDISVAVDVSFAMCGGENPVKCGELGKGCMIGIAPSLDRGLSKEFIRLAEDKKQEYQREVMNGTTGTNADRFSVNRCGSRAVTLSIPLRYMHTPAEVVDIADVMATADLITAFLKEGTVR